MTTAREGIIDNVATVLATITTGNGYAQTVARVDRYMRDYDEVDAVDKPWLGFWVQSESSEHLPFKQIDSTMQLVVVGYVAPTHTGDETAFQALATEQISNLRHDVITAMMSDPRRDANAISTMVATVETDEGVGEAPTQKNGGTAAMKLGFTILYEESTED